MNKNLFLTSVHNVVVLWLGNDSNDELLEMSLWYDNAVDNVRLDNDIKWLVWFGLDAICANVHKSVRDVNGVKLPYIFLISCNRWNETKYERVENGRNMMNILAIILMEETLKVKITE